MGPAVRRVGLSATEVYYTLNELRLATNAKTRRLEIDALMKFLMAARGSTAACRVLDR
ncbi:hypothetical protein Q31a_06610 [Aureliella helgolandensis]|uniref:Uncharacterized protein n=1 Tax=Aureliella helgolandensis TaxID=2527968 RepID=A0A518G1A3_9BACT|nr:hypothetical protein Q31a_06610 [Aureliella helgolandensis]